MKRNLAIREFIKLLRDDDIIVASGKTICNEAYQFDRPLLFYFEDSTIAQNVALGMANGTERRVFIFCSDNAIQNDLDFILQMGLSKKDNIICVVFKSAEDADLINNTRSLIGALFNIGPDTYNYSTYFSKVSNVPKVQGHVLVLRGPAIILIDVKASNIDTSFIDTNYTSIKDVINGRDISKK